MPAVTSPLGDGEDDEKRPLDPLSRDVQLERASEQSAFGMREVEVLQDVLELVQLHRVLQHAPKPREENGGGLLVDVELHLEMVQIHQLVIVARLPLLAH